MEAISSEQRSIDTSIVAALTRDIARLTLCNQSLATYYNSLVAHPDEILRVAAMAALLEIGLLKVEHAPLVVAAAKYAAIRERAFKYFIGVYEYDLAERIAGAPQDDMSDLQAAWMQAQVGNDHHRLLELEPKLFLADGMVEHLYEAGRQAERLQGWQAALPWFTRALMAQPADPTGPFKVLSTLADANQVDVLEAVCAAFRAAKVYPIETTVYSALVLSAKGRANDALKMLQPMGKIADQRMAVVAAHVRAEALDKLGQYTQAFVWYSRQHELGRVDDIDPQQFTRNIVKRAAFTVDPLPPDPNSATHLMMAGFPRSGTTLLENALAAHPAVETFEEVPSLSGALMLIDRDIVSGRVGLALATEARRRYYHELERERHKADARYFVDKLPLFSAHIAFLERLFPERRYIFSIRHPYDVVLSCFKQIFNPNSAMENFRNLADACKLYDFVMSQWFAVFDLSDSDRVCYIRYEELVGDFTATARKALDFIGAGWSDEVLRFSELAERRAVKTPSYSKVRQGLGLGLQSGWRNYEFLFQRKEAQVLRKWADYFGYDVAANSAARTEIQGSRVTA